MKKKLQLFICFISTIVCSISFLSWLPGILLNKVDRLSLLAAGVMLPDGKIFEEKGDCQASNIVSTINFGQRNTVLASNTTDETVDNFLKTFQHLSFRIIRMNQRTKSWNACLVQVELNIRIFS